MGHPQATVTQPGHRAPEQACLSVEQDSASIGKAKYIHFGELRAKPQRRRLSLLHLPHEPSPAHHAGCGTTTAGRVHHDITPRLTHPSISHDPCLRKSSIPHSYAIHGLDSSMTCSLHGPMCAYVMAVACSVPCTIAPWQ